MASPLPPRSTSFSDLVATSHAVSATSKRSEKVALLADYLNTLLPGDLRLAVLYLSGQIPQRAIGIGWAALNDDIPPAASPSLSLVDVDTMLDEINELRGEGSVGMRANTLGATYSRLTSPEQTFLNGLLLDNIRQGALSGIMTDAVAKGAGVPLAAVRRALMLTADLATVAVDAMEGGVEALQRHHLTLFQPIQPMLAKTAGSAESAAEELGDVTVDVKVDGARVQVHKYGSEVRVYTRSLREIKPSNISELVGAVDADSLILDGEAVGISDDGSMLSFPDTMGNLEVDTGSTFRGLGVRFFDILHLDGRDLIDLPLSERLAALDQAIPAPLRVDRLDGPNPADAEQFFSEVVAAGAEGVMVKDRNASYAAGRRGAAWRKVKPVHTLDLVVLAVEWGSGRRQGFLSNIHLGARDGADFVMLGKTFKGMTDEMLQWQTDRFLELEISRKNHVVFLRPEQVVEVAIDGVLPSPRYPGGVSLRFARVKRYRDDKRAAEADTLDTVRAFLR